MSLVVSREPSGLWVVARASLARWQRSASRTISKRSQKVAGIPLEVKLLHVRTCARSWMAKTTYAHMVARSLAAVASSSNRPSVASNSLFLLFIAPKPHAGSHSASSP